MDKYSLLIILNIPFVFFGIINTIVLFREKAIRNLMTFARISFWVAILLGLVFAEDIYRLLFQNNLTDTTPLSLADVLLVTGVMLTLSMCISLYSKNEFLERRLSDLHEELSIYISKRNH